MRLDAVIFGGGAVGLWTLDRLRAAGRSALLIESGTLGSGQTVASQGIIHGGLKYTLGGVLTRSAEKIRDMPALWRSCLAGESAPDLSACTVRSDFCHLWRTESLTSRVGMIGARVGLRVAPKTLAAGERPGVLDGCPGTVSRLDEQVIDAVSFVVALRTRNLGRLVHVPAADDVKFAVEADTVTGVSVATGAGPTLSLEPRHVVFAAGAGNADLLTRVGRETPPMQRRPLHMAMLRGDLPNFHGHCVDGAKTRITVTSQVDAAGRTVWQLGGQIAEDGVAMDGPTLVAHAERELRAVLPAVDLTDVEWATYRVDRAEEKTAGGLRPEGVRLDATGNVLTGWPTKLVLAPVLADEIVSRVAAGPAVQIAASDRELLAVLPRPDVAAPPWETADWAGGRDAAKRAA
ncbi:MAG: FAD-dependent oxidoreductase [Planctomycetota bacterium]